MSRFFSSKYASLEAYVPGEQPQDMQYVKLNTNESPFPPSESVVNAATKAAGKLNLYSDPECKKIVSKLAEVYGVKAENVIVELSFLDDEKDTLYVSGKSIEMIGKGKSGAKIELTKAELAAGITITRKSGKAVYLSSLQAYAK